MRNIHICFYIVLVLICGAGPVYAEEDMVEHGTHNPYRDSGIPVNAAQAMNMAASVRDIMVQRGDLAKSWAAIKITEAKQRTYNNEKEWIVILTNPQEKEQNRKTLYIFLDTFGDVVDMNFTGQ